MYIVEYLKNCTQHRIYDDSKKELVEQFDNVLFLHLSSGYLENGELSITFNDEGIDIETLTGTITIFNNSTLHKLTQAINALTCDSLELELSEELRTITITVV